MGGGDTVQANWSRPMSSVSWEHVGRPADAAAGAREVCKHSGCPAPLVCTARATEARSVTSSPLAERVVGYRKLDAAVGTRFERHSGIVCGTAFLASGCLR